MRYLLDTNICIYIIKNKPDTVLNHFLKFNPGDIALSVITLSELNYGVARSAKPVENAIALMQFIQPLIVLPFTHHEAQVYGKLRAELESKGKPIGAMDYLIAAQAISLNLTLVSNNEKEFERIAYLRLENWTK